MMIFRIAVSTAIVLFLVISAIASSDKWDDEIQRHYDSEKEDSDE